MSKTDRAHMEGIVVAKSVDGEIVGKDGRARREIREVGGNLCKLEALAVLSEIYCSWLFYVILCILRMGFYDVLLPLFRGHE